MTSAARRHYPASAFALPLQMLAGLVIGLILAMAWPSFAASLQADRHRLHRGDSDDRDFR